MKVYTFTQTFHRAAVPGYWNAADDADLTERVIREAASSLPIYVVNFVIFALMYLMFVTGSYPSASSDQEISVMFLRARIRISFMSIFARFMYVFSPPPVSPPVAKISTNK